MRLIIIGNERERQAIRDALEHSPPEIVAEFPSPAEARGAGIRADGIVQAVGVLADESVDGTSPDESYAEPLTPRELEVLELIAEGLPNKSIAARLGISDQTVKFHVSSIHGKLGAANRTDAVRRAVRRGLLTL
jgi:DNA-binding CsgD family transcriptional regulator